MVKPSPIRTPGHRGRTLALFGLLCLQTFCALFLLADAVADIFGLENLLGGITHHYLEFAFVVALVLGIGFTAGQIREVLRKNRSMETTLRAASGAFNQLMEDQFDLWALTPSERDVALLAIKGLSISQIAELRQTKEGTIKAQCNAVYRKAGVTGRLQLMSLFIEELMGEGLADLRPSDSAASQPPSVHGPAPLPVPRRSVTARP